MTVVQPSPKAGLSWLWFLCSLMIVGLGGLLTIGHKDDTQWSQQSIQSCSTLAGGNSTGCMTLLELRSQQSDVLKIAQPLLKDCWMEQYQQWIAEAKEWAARGNHPKAMQIADRISIDSECYREAQQVREASAQRIVAIAQEFYQDPIGRLNDAIAALKEIPRSSLMYDLAQRKIVEWQQTWASSEQHRQAATLALGSDDFATVLNEMSQMIDHPYWKIQADILSAEVNRKQERYLGLWKHAQDFKQQGDFDQATELTMKLPIQGEWGEKREILLNDIKIAREAKLPFQMPWAQLTLGTVLILIERLVHGSRHPRRR